MIGAWSAWHYQGQTCITAGRHIVARELYEPYVEALAAKAAAIAVGDPAREEVGLGPMINERQRDRGHSSSSDSVAPGRRRWSRAARTTASSTARPWSPA